MPNLEPTSLLSQEMQTGSLLKVSCLKPIFFSSPRNLNRKKPVVNA